MKSNLLKYDNKILKYMFLKLLPQQMLIGIILSLNTLIDSFFTSRFLGSTAMAALGLYVPISNILNLCYVLISGTQILCGNSIGRGQAKKTVSIFSTASLVLIIYSIICSLAMNLFSMQIAGILGATGECAQLLSSYLRGMSFGVIGMIMYALFVAFLQLNNSSSLAKSSLITMIASNFVLDFVFMYVFNMGMFGLGLASSISSLMSMVIALFGVINSRRKPVVYLKMDNLSIDMVPEMIRLGSTEIVFNLCIAFRSFFINSFLLKAGGNDAVAVMTVLNMACCFIGAISAGSSGTVLTLGSIFSGEKNRSELSKLYKFALKISLSMSLITIILINIFAPQVASIFYSSDQAAYPLTISMLHIFAWFILFASINQITAKIRQSQGQIIVNTILPVFDNALTIVLAFILSNTIGLEGIWAAFPLGEASSTLVIFLFIVLTLHRVPRTIQDLVMAIPHNSSAPKQAMTDEKENESTNTDDEISFTVRSMDEVVSVSSRLSDFCNKNGLNKRISYMTALASEELAGNIIEHGFNNKQKNTVDIYATRDGEHLKLRLRDDCVTFDPVQYLDQFQQKDMTTNIGLKLVAKTASDMKYQRLLGLNYLTITI